MKSLRSNRILGIAVSQDGLSIAEVAPDGPTRRKLLHASDFRFPEGLSLTKPAELGRALAQHLRSKGISTRDVAMGLPAKWLVTRRKDLPPSSPEAAASSLRLQAEAEFASEQNSLAIDYAGNASPTRSAAVLLVATSHSHLDPCQAMIRSAGLHLRSVTATGIALAEASVNGAGRYIIIHRIPSGAELIVQNNGAPMLLGHVTLPEGADAIAPLSSEIRRALAGLPGQGKTELVLCAGPTTDPTLAAALEQRLSMPVIPADITPQIHSEGADPHAFAPAIALALAAMDPKRAHLDFIHSRLTPPRTHMSRRPYVWAAAIAASLLLAGVIAVTDLQSNKRELASMKDRLTGMADDLKTAQSSADRLAVARAYSTAQPRFLGCLAELTNLFPDEGSIWATTLNLRENMAGQVAGKASGTQQILALLDRMKDDRRFASPKLLDMRDSGPSGREVAFTIAFEFRPVE